MSERYCKFQFQEVYSDGSSNLYDGRSTDWIKLGSIRSLILNRLMYDEVIFLEDYGFTSSQIYKMVFKGMEDFPFCSIGLTTSNRDILLTNVPYSDDYVSVRGYLFIIDSIGDEDSIICINNITDFLEITRGISKTDYFEEDIIINDKKYKEGINNNLCKQSHKVRKRVTYPKNYWQRAKELGKFCNNRVDDEYVRYLSKSSKWKSKVDTYKGISDYYYYYSNPNNYDKCWKDYTKNKNQYGVNLDNAGIQWNKEEENL